MRIALYLPNFGAFGQPQVLCDLARRAEEAGWDGFFLWDHLIADPPVSDPWVVLGAVAVDTQTIRLGAMVTPLARRRPWRVALETSTLHHISDGRALLGVGLGVPWDFSRFGEPAESDVRIAKLEEGLAVVRRLLEGEAVTHEGAHYRLEDVTFPAAAVPIWVSGWWPRRLPIHGAALADGLFPNWRDDSAPLHFRPPSPDETRQIKERFVADGGPAAGDIAIMSVGAGDKVDFAAYEEAGATWWFETFWRDPLEQVMDVVEAGPESLRR
jgi:alkanesulfonate monooxygenase SsuD/methylene tetrahydromethanopterin reductase-like flavin-dependent oxidoreductase (luciferase family)